MAFLGRITPEKRVDLAIEIAKRTGMRLRIASKVDPVDRAYFEAGVEPLLRHPLIDYIGEINDAEKERVSRRRRGTGLSLRLNGSVRPGLDRGAGLRHTGHYLRSWTVSGDH